MNILIVSQYFWPENFRINDLALALKDRKSNGTSAIMRDCFVVRQPRSAADFLRSAQKSSRNREPMSNRFSYQPFRTSP